MTDRPNLPELLHAVRIHIENSILPVIRPDPRLYFQTLVALNLLKIGQRELADGANILREEWQAINQLTGENLPLPERDSDIMPALMSRRGKLSESIRRGEYDSPAASAQLMSHVERVVAAQLTLNNPGLAARLASEIAENAYAV